MPSLFASPPKTPKPVAPMPMPDEENLAKAKNKAMKKLQSGSGRDATVLQDSADTLGS